MYLWTPGPPLSSCYILSPQGSPPPGLSFPDNAQIPVLSLCYFYLFLIRNIPIPCLFSPGPGVQSNKAFHAKIWVVGHHPLFCSSHWYLHCNWGLLKPLTHWAWKTNLSPYTHHPPPSPSNTKGDVVRMDWPLLSRVLFGGPTTGASLVTNNSVPESKGSDLVPVGTAFWHGFIHSTHKQLEKRGSRRNAQALREWAIGCLYSDCGLTTSVLYNVEYSKRERERDSGNCLKMPGD